MTSPRFTGCDVVRVVPPAASHEMPIPEIGCSSVRERDGLRPFAVVDLPASRLVLGEGRTRAVANEHQRVAGRTGMAVEIDDGIVFGLPSVEHEDVVAGASVQEIYPNAAWFDRFIEPDY